MFISRISEHLRRVAQLVVVVKLLRQAVRTLVVVGEERLRGTSLRHAGVLAVVVAGMVRDEAVLFALRLRDTFLLLRLVLVRVELRGGSWFVHFTR